MPSDVDNFFERHRPQLLAELVGNRGAKTVLQRMFARQLVPNGILLHGPKGCGKTSAARIIIRIEGCLDRPPGASVPCGSCGACLDPFKYENLTGVNVIIRNCAALSMDDVDADLGRGPARDKLIVFYDEAHRARERIQDRIVTYLEEPDRSFLFLMATPELKDVDEGLRQRMDRVGFRPPTTSEMMAHLEAVCSKEGVRVVERSVLRELCELGENVPRECLNLLRHLLLHTDELTVQQLELLRTDLGTVG